MIAVQITKNFQNIDVPLSKIEKLVKTICNRFKLANATISIAIVDDTQMRKVNAQFTSHKSTTDCLSFDLSDEPSREVGSDHSPARRASAPSRQESGRSFELVVNGELALKQANLRGHSSEAELALYITHSLLHNLGFDDSTQNQAQKMHDTEDEILQQFGYGLVYNKDK
ncbi:MAG: rRNA maturation RNase YbeY [Phycisphaerae bacterium]